MMRTRSGLFCDKLADARRARHGFSLAELLVVIAIVGLLAGFTLPRLDSARFRADANVRLVRIVLQQAQRLSLQQQHDVIVSFDIAGGKIRIVEDSDNSRAITPGEPVAWRGLTDGGEFLAPSAGINGAVNSAVVGASVTTLDNMPTVTFHRSGSSSSNLEVYLSVKGRKLDAVRAVTLVQSTGRTAWFKYNGSVWAAGGM